MAHVRLIFVHAYSPRQIRQNLLNMSARAINITLIYALTRCNITYPGYFCDRHGFIVNQVTSICEASSCLNQFYTVLQSKTPHMKHPNLESSKVPRDKLINIDQPWLVPEKPDIIWNSHPCDSSTYQEKAGLIEICGSPFPNVHFKPQKGLPDSRMHVLRSLQALAPPSPGIPAEPRAQRVELLLLRVGAHRRADLNETVGGRWTGRSNGAVGRT